MELEPVSNGALAKAEACVQDKHLERKKTNQNQPRNNKHPLNQSTSSQTSLCNSYALPALSIRAQLGVPVLRQDAMSAELHKKAKYWYVNILWIFSETN